MTKTIKEWFELLPEPHKTQAISNYDPNYQEDYLDREIAESSLDNALLFGFDWAKTPEGGEYWCDLHDSLINQSA